MLVRLLLLTLVLIVPTLLYAQDFTRTIERTAHFADPDGIENRLFIKNIHGSVTVEGYEGEVVRITARQQIDGTAREVERAKEELSLIIDSEGNRVYVYIDAPFITVRKQADGISYSVNRQDDDYDFLFDITVQVPRSTYVETSTVNRGTVSVKNITGGVSASNVNGEVKLQEISGAAEVRTVNGNITARFSESPAEECSFRTINGTIETYFPEDLAADVRFKSLHGDLYTDFNNTSRLQNRVDKGRSSGNGSVRYRIDKFAPIRIGEGGTTLRFDVLNGDVYIKQIES